MNISGQILAWMKHAVLTLFLALGAVLAAQPVSGPKEPLRLETTVDAMGSTYGMVLYGDNQEALRAAADDAAEEVRRLDRMLSNYNPSSEWSEVNRGAAEKPVRVSTELFDLLSACLNYSRASEGAFDITVGPLMKVWGFYKGSGHLPHRAEIRGALARVGYRNIILDPTARTVRFARPGVEMDPGGIGKGYAVDRMADVLRKDGIRVGFIGGSGSSIYALGAPPSEPRGWKVSIKNPRNPSETIKDLYLKDESMSTSGNYEKFFFAEGRMYSHIMDPRTGWPAEGVLQVSVVAPRTIDSEAWTKPYYVNGRSWAAAHKAKEFRVFLCEGTYERTKETSCAWLQ
jgi:thiamine biosynthesis lipoprotein